MVVFRIWCKGVYYFIENYVIREENRNFRIIQTSENWNFRKIQND